MILNKWYGRDRLACFYKKFYFAIEDYLFQADRIRRFIISDIFAPDFCITIKVKRSSHNKTQYNLAKYLKPTG